MITASVGVLKAALENNKQEISGKIDRMVSRTEAIEAKVEKCD